MRLVSIAIVVLLCQAVQAQDYEALATQTQGTATTDKCNAEGVRDSRNTRYTDLMDYHYYPYSSVHANKYPLMILMHQHQVDDFESGYDEQLINQESATNNAANYFNDGVGHFNLANTYYGVGNFLGAYNEYLIAIDKFGDAYSEWAAAITAMDEAQNMLDQALNVMSQY